MNQLGPQSLRALRCLLLKNYFLLSLYTVSLIGIYYIFVPILRIDIYPENMKKIQVLSFLVLLTVLSFGFTSPQEKIIILLSSKCTKTEELAAKELRRYIYLRRGDLAEIRRVDVVPEAAARYIVILSGNEKLGFELPDLQREEYVIKTVNGQQSTVNSKNDKKGSEYCIIYGGDGIGALYGAYRFAEYIGIRFYLHGDVIPDERADITFPDKQITGKPLFKLRGIMPFHDFPQGPDWWNTDDYKAIIAQLAKMGLNFIGLHTYPEKKSEGWCEAEPNVWVGTKDQINEDGTVKSAYPAMHANTGVWTWDHGRKKTSDFSLGASQMFEKDNFGAEYMMNVSDWPHTDAENIEIFNKTGRMYKSSFNFARRLGVKTCTGTEIPLTIPEKVKDRLKAEGKDPDSDEAKAEVYEGMFTRLKMQMPTDYYWFWTKEEWTWWGEKPGEVENDEKEFEIAIKAKNKVNAPFTLATAGWVLGPSRDRTEFDNLLPKDMPFSCINREMGFIPVDKGFKDIKDREKWAIPWMEDDPALTSPELWAGRIRRDAIDAYNYGCQGLMGLHWRTEPLGPAITALSKAAWRIIRYNNLDSEELMNSQSSVERRSVDASPNENDITRLIPDTNKRVMPVDDLYKDWAEAQFGRNVAPEMAAIFTSLDGSPKLKPGKNPERIAYLFRSSDWTGGGPGGLKANRKPWIEVKENFAYLDKLEQIKDKVRGKGNKQRFDYWYNFLTYNRTMAEVCCTLGQIDTLMGTIKAEKNADIKRKIAEREVIPLKKKAEEKWGEMITQLLEIVNTPGEMGTIANHEQHNLTRMKTLSKYDSTLSAITEKNISTDLPKEYRGASRLIVPTKRTLLEMDESLNIKAIVLSQKGTESVEVYWRKLGDKEYKKKTLEHIARGVYKGEIGSNEIGANDFEYYIEAKTGDEVLHFPVTAPELNQTLVIW
jgi:hypothetical protein